jgi:ribosomal protein S18 acetylase RimI-like enzyme
MSDKLRVLIRAAEERDLRALEWEGEYKHFRRIYQRIMQEALKGRRLLLVAEAEGSLIGQIFIYFDTGWSQFFNGRSTAYLHSFRVKERYRNRGLGRLLLERAEQELLDRGFAHAVISVAKDNRAARRLYEQFGYRVFNEDEGEWNYLDHEGVLQTVIEPAYVLQKTLSVPPD